MRFMIALASALVLVAPALAGGSHCHRFQSTLGDLRRPKPPSCMDMPFAVTNETSFDDCRNDTKVYLNDVDDYIKCLNEEANDASREGNAVVARFNCKISGAICS